MSCTNDQIFRNTFIFSKGIDIIISLFKVEKHTKRKKKKTHKKIDVNLEHREHLPTTQNKKKKHSAN